MTGFSRTRWRPRQVVRERGVTLHELLVVAAILGVVALTAIPNLSSSDEETLSLASAEVAAAIRYARGQAMATGAEHGVRIVPATVLVTVYKVDLASNPPGIAFVLTHPVDKKPYTLDLAGGPPTAGVEMTGGDPFQFAGLGTRQDLFFDAAGAPLYIQGGASYPLTTGAARLSYHGQEHTISVAPETGRVTIQ